MVVILAEAGLIFLCEKNKLTLPRRGAVVWSVPAAIFLVAGAVTVFVYTGLTISEQPIAALAYRLLLMTGLTIFAVTDHYVHLIPNILLIVLLCAWVLISALAILFDLPNGLQLAAIGVAGGLFSGFCYLICYFLSKKRMGAGDVKLAFFAGLCLTGEMIVGALLLCSLSCLLWSLVLIVRKKMKWSDEVPMAPFLFFGSAAMLLLSGGLG